MNTIELERTYLAKTLPHNLQSYPHKEIIDHYIPVSSIHPSLRIRKNGLTYEITKKSPLNADDRSTQLEQTIVLDESEFNALAQLEAKCVRKVRYYYPYQGLTAQIDIFQNDLKGLVLIDFEFTSQNERQAFIMPDFCLAEVTSEEFIAGGMLCGKKFEDIVLMLKKFNYNCIKF